MSWPKGYDQAEKHYYKNFDPYEDEELEEEDEEIETETTSDSSRELEEE